MSKILRKTLGNAFVNKSNQKVQNLKFV